jgi:phosphate transport system permease protein
VQITLKAGSPQAIQDALTLGGEITKVQDKLSPALNEDGTPGETREWQLFLGNKDVYGLAFKFIDLDQIETTEQPRDLIKLERLEYGPALAFPVSLNLKDGVTIPASAPGFRAELERRVDEVNERRAEIKRIEKKEIGAINHQMNKLRLRQRARYQLE